MRHTPRPASEPRKAKPISTCASFPNAVTKFFAVPCVVVVEDYRMNRREAGDAKNADAAAMWAQKKVKALGRGLQGVRATITPKDAPGLFVLRENPDKGLTWRWLPVGME